MTANNSFVDYKNEKISGFKRFCSMSLPDVIIRHFWAVSITLAEMSDVILAAGSAT